MKRRDALKLIPALGFGSLATLSAPKDAQASSKEVEKGVRLPDYVDNERGIILKNNTLYTMDGTQGELVTKYHNCTIGYVGFHPTQSENDNTL